MKRFLAILVIALVATLSTQAQPKAGEVQIAGNKGAADIIKLDSPEPVKAQQPVTLEEVKAMKAVKGKSSFLRSHIKSLGSIGLTQRYEIISIRIRGLDSPNVSVVGVYDKATDQFLTGPNGTGPGLGAAIIGGGAHAAGSFLFGSNLRPNKQTINNGSNSGSSASGGNSNASGGNSSAKGGNSEATGGAANSDSASDATGGAANSVSDANSASNSVSDSTSTATGTGGEGGLGGAGGIGGSATATGTGGAGGGNITGDKNH